jgi:hypothetical protein
MNATLPPRFVSFRRACLHFLNAGASYDDAVATVRAKILRGEIVIGKGQA